MKRKYLTPTLIYFILIIGLIIFSLPYIYMVISATQTNDVIFSSKLNFKPGPHFLANLKEVHVKYNYLRILYNSAIITVVGTILSTFITTLAGYVMAKYKFRGSNLIFNLIEPIS